MKRALLILALVLPPLVTAASAASARPGLPTAVDFELVPPPAHVASQRVLSRPLRAPRSFSLVGLRWRGSAQPVVSLRVRKAGRHWSRWLTMPGAPDGEPDPRSAERRSSRGESAPVWAGRADFVQYRLSRRVPGLRLHFVRVDPNGWRPRARRAQTPGETAIQPRSAWDPANQCPPRIAPEYGDVQAAFVHHTVSLNDYQPQDVPSIILGICRFHRNSNGWNDIGYNFLVDKFGTLWEGRAGGIDQPVVGAQAQGYNTQSTGIANIGTFSDVPQSDAALNAMAQLIRWKLPLTGAPTAGTTTLVSAGGSANRYPAGTPVTLERVSGHRDVDSTECPGVDLYNQLPALRALVGNVKPVKQRTRLAATLQPPLLAFPQSTQISGSVALVNTTPFGAAPLQVELYGSGAWHTVARVTSAPDGTFSMPFAPRAGHTLRVVYAGDGSRLPSTSQKLTLQVRPTISLKRSVARAAVGRTPTISGTIRPAKTRLRLVVNRKVGTRTKRVASFRLRARNGRFRKSYRLPSPGLYSYRVLFAGDSANLKATSNTLYVRAIG